AGCGRAAEWDTPRSESTEKTERGLSQAAAGTQWTALRNARPPTAAAGALRSGPLRGPSQRSRRSAACPKPQRGHNQQRSGMLGRQLRLRARCGVGHSAVRVNGADGARLVPSRSGDTIHSALECSAANRDCGRAAEWDTPRSESTEQTERGLSQAAAGTQQVALGN